MTDQLTSAVIVVILSFVAAVDAIVVIVAAVIDSAKYVKAEVLIESRLLLQTISGLEKARTPSATNWCSKYPMVLDFEKLKQ